MFDPERLDPTSPSSIGQADRRSVRVALAALLLRHGRTPAQAAEAAGVPFALTEWLAEHPERSPSRRGHGGDVIRCAIPVDVGADRELVSATASVRSPNGATELLRARWRVRALSVVLIGLLLNCVIAVPTILGLGSRWEAAVVVATTATVVVTLAVLAGLAASTRRGHSRPRPQ